MLTDARVLVAELPFFPLFFFLSCFDCANSDHLLPCTDQMVGHGTKTADLLSIRDPMTAVFRD